MLDLLVRIGMGDALRALIAILINNDSAASRLSQRWFT